jgi:predicted nucleic acid-binding Zn ribbon protein
MPDDPNQPDDLDAAESRAAADASARALRRVTRSTTPRRTSTATRRGSSSRDPQLLGDAVERLVEESGWGERSAVAVLMADWAEIVGADLADHVTPTSFEEGELLLAAESTAWATQVRLLLPQLHRAVDERVGAGVVRVIRIQGPQAPSWTAGPRRVPGRGPRDTYG